MKNSNQPHTCFLALANAAPRCGAKTRSGHPCKGAAVSGKKRCRMHGGASGSGAPSGEKNGRYKYGQFTGEAVALRHEGRQLLREMAKLIKLTG